MKAINRYNAMLDQKNQGVVNDVEAFYQGLVKLRQAEEAKQKAQIMEMAKLLNEDFAQMFKKKGV